MILIVHLNNCNDAPETLFKIHERKVQFYFDWKEIKYYHF